MRSNVTSPVRISPMTVARGNNGSSHLDLRSAEPLFCFKAIFLFLLLIVEYVTRGMATIMDKISLIVAHISDGF